MGRTMTYYLEQRKFKNNQALAPIYMVLTKKKSVYPIIGIKVLMQDMMS